MTAIVILIEPLLPWGKSSQHESHSPRNRPRLTPNSLQHIAPRLRVSKISWPMNSYILRSPSAISFGQRRIWNPVHEWMLGIISRSVETREMQHENQLRRRERWEDCKDEVSSMQKILEICVWWGGISRTSSRECCCCQRLCHCYFPEVNVWGLWRDSAHPSYQLVFRFRHCRSEVLSRGRQSEKL
jgi:hypothetical protein